MTDPVVSAPDYPARGQAVAGTQRLSSKRYWIPAFAGMTHFDHGIPDE